MTSSYVEIQCEIQSLDNKKAALLEQAKQARDQERMPIIEEIGKLIALYDITLPELFPRALTKASKKRIKRVPKYRDPISGKEWSGAGSSPNWMKGKNPNDFLIRKENPGIKLELPESRYITEDVIPVLHETLELVHLPNTSDDRKIPQIIEETYHLPNTSSTISI